MTDDDLTLETLLAVRNELAPELDATVLTQCYQIQKRFQFSGDRSLSSSEMERLIDKQVEKLVASSQG